MRHYLLDSEELVRSIGAAVVRSLPGGITLDLGPADGAPQFRLSLTQPEAMQLSRALQLVASGKTNEEVIIVES